MKVQMELKGTTEDSMYAITFLQSALFAIAEQLESYVIAEGPFEKHDYPVKLIYEDDETDVRLELVIDRPAP